MGILSMVVIFIFGLFSKGGGILGRSSRSTTATFLAEEKMEEALSESESFATGTTSGAFSGAFSGYRYQISLSNYTHDHPEIKTVQVEVTSPQGERVSLISLKTVHVISLAAGTYHTMALKDDGTVWGWGYDNYGQLGNNSIGQTNFSAVPVQACESAGMGAGKCSKALMDVTAIAGGSYHTLFLKKDGTVWSSGQNSYGQLGDGSKNNHPVPVPVLGCVGCKQKFLSGVQEVAGSMSDDFSLALQNDGTVWAWGHNNAGQLGNGKNGEATNSSTPVEVCMEPGLESPICKSALDHVAGISAGFAHSLAAKSDGTVWAWGSNDYGQLGSAAPSFQSFNSTPVVVCARTGGVIGECTEPLKNVIAVAAGFEHSLALKEDGTVWAWGNNAFGQLGNNNAGSEGGSSTPVQVCSKKGEMPGHCAGYLNNVVAIAAGGYHSLALKKDGTVWAWGSDAFGQLGNNNSGISNFSAVAVEVCESPGNSPGSCGAYLHAVAAITAGYYHSLAIKSDGTAWAWGNNAYGQLGLGKTSLHEEIPVPSLRF